MAKYEVTIDGKQCVVEIVRDDGCRALLNVDGREYEVEAHTVSGGSAPAPRPSPAEVAPTPQRSPSAPVAPAVVPDEGEPGEMRIRAPMPGLVLEVCASVGQRVEKGDPLLRLEAMKMENDIQSHVAGTVKEILVAKGDDVQEGEVLMVLEA